MIKKLFQKAIALTLVALCALMPVAPMQALAATPNVTPGAGQVVVIPFHISGQYTASTTAVVRFAMPFPCRVLGVGASARASGGTSPTLTVDVLNAAVSILSAPISVTAGSYTEGAFTATGQNIADEAAITVNLAITGTSPTWNDIVVFITVVRR